MSLPSSKSRAYHVGSSRWSKVVTDEARAAFSKADKTKCGFLDLEEFIEAIKCLVSDVLSSEELLKYFIRGDLGQNGRIYMHVFVKMFVNDIARKHPYGLLAEDGPKKK